MKCLIIAAGQGRRLSAKGDSKPLIPLLGLSLIERVVLTANKAGLTDFYVVTGYNGEKVKRFLDRFSQRGNIKITHITNEEWAKEITKMWEEKLKDKSKKEVNKWL
jgi:choline kinase